AVTEPPGGEAESPDGPDTEPPDTQQPPGGSEVDEQIRALVGEIVAAQAEIDAALQQSPPDYAAAGVAQNELRGLLDRLARLSGVSATSAGTLSESGGSAGAGSSGTSGEAGSVGDGPPASTTPTTAPARPASA